MDAKKFVEQLRREALAHPAKAGLLALMCGVLIYVLSPLLMSKDKPVAVDAATKTKNDAVAPAPMETTRATVAPAAEKTAKDWRQIADQIDADANMKSAEALTSDRDPFAPPPEPKIVESELEKPEEKQPEPKKLHFTPAEAGLVLNSTLRGKKSRLAMVNGKSFYVYDSNKADNRRSVIPFATPTHGREIETPTGESGEGEFFVLIDVHPRSVVLWRLGRHYELKLPGIELASGSQPNVPQAFPNPVIPLNELAP